MNVPRSLVNKTSKPPKIAAVAKETTITTLKNPRINIDVIECNDTVERLKSVVKQYENDLLNNQSAKNVVTQQLSDLTNQKMELAAKLTPIDEVLQTTSKDIINKDIQSLQTIVNNENQKAVNLNKLAAEQVQIFDNTALETIAIEIQKANDTVNECLDRWQKTNNQLKDFERTIQDINVKKQQAIDVAINDIKNDIKATETEVKILIEGVNTDKKTAVLLKENITALEKSKKCVTCNQDLRPEDIEHIQPTIIAKQNELLTLKETYVKKNEALEIHYAQIDTLKLKLQDIQSQNNLPAELIIILNNFYEQIDKVKASIVTIIEHVAALKPAI